MLKYSEFKEAIEQTKLEDKKSKFERLSGLVEKELRLLISSKHRDLLNKTLLVANESVTKSNFDRLDYEAVCEDLQTAGYTVEVKSKYVEPEDFEIGGTYYGLEFTL